MRTKYLMMPIITGMLGLATLAGVSLSKPDTSLARQLSG